MAELSLSSASASASKKQVIIVCHYPFSSSDKQYEIYVLDLDDFGDKPIRTKGLQCLTPVFDLDFTYPRDAAFAVSDSNFYMIGGYNSKESKWINEVYSYPMKHVQQLQQKAITTTLHSLAFTHGPYMKGNKFAPVAMPVGGGSFCVFSTLLFHPFPIRGCDFTNLYNFEVYDPVENSWYQLPEPFPYNQVSSRVDVDAYAFDYQQSELIISVDGFGVFVLCLTKPVKEWMPLLLPRDNYIGRLPFIGNSVIIDRIWFTSVAAHDTSADFEEPLTLFDPDESDYSYSYAEVIKPVHCLGSHICYLGDQQICVVTAGFPQFDKCWDTLEDATPYLQVYVADVAGVMDMSGRNANYPVKRFRTLRYILPSALTHSVDVHCLFPLSN